MKKKILIITPGPIFNNIRINIMKRLSTEFEFTCITTSPLKKYTEKKMIDSIKWYCVRSGRSSYFLTNLIFLIYCVIVSLNLRLKKQEIDLVTTYDPLKTGLLGSICSFILNSKFVPEINGVYTSPYEYFDESGKLSTKIKRLIYPIIEAFVIWRADGIKLLFPSQIDYFKGLLKDKVIRHFPNYINIDDFLKIDTSKEKKEILFIGFPFYRKGVDVLIRAFRIVYIRYPEWKLKILGWYPQKNTLISFIDNHPGIEHIPPVWHEEVPKHIENCSIFVLPSRSEAMGRVLIETMAAGKARIGTNVDGIPLVISHNNDGLLFENENPNDLAEKIIYLIENPSQRKKIGLEGRARAKKYFNESVYFTNISDFYNEILSS